MLADTLTSNATTYLAICVKSSQRIRVSSHYQLATAASSKHKQLSFHVIEFKANPLPSTSAAEVSEADNRLGLCAERLLCDLVEKRNTFLFALRCVANEMTMQQQRLGGLKPDKYLLENQLGVPFSIFENLLCLSQWSWHKLVWKVSTSVVKKLF